MSPLGEVRMLPVGSLHPYPANARRIPAKAVEQTAASIAEFGWQQPIVVDTDADRVIVIGHVRWRSAQKLGLAEAPVVVAEGLTAAQIKALRIVDNRSHDYTSWDYGMLADELAGLDDFAAVLDLADWEGIITGFVEERDRPGLDLGQERQLFAPEFLVTVIFASRDDADRAGPALLKIPGVLDVRYRLAPE